MKYEVVTSFSDKLWRQYAKTTVPSVFANLPSGVKKSVWFNGEFSEEWQRTLGSDVEFFDLNVRSDYQYFRQAYKHRPSPKNVPEGHKFRFNFLPFWNKVCAIRNSVENSTADVLVWVDADLYSQKPIEEKDFKRWLNKCDVAGLSRSDPWNTWETGFLMFDLRSPFVVDFVNDVYNVYMTGQIFDFNEWHDAFLFTTFWKQYKDILTFSELNQVPSRGHCFDTSVLYPYLAHLKGGERKATGKFFDPSGLNAVLRADFCGVIGVQEDKEIKLTKAGNIAIDGELRS